MIELVAGIVLLILAVALWRGRRSLARRELPGRSSGGGSALITGASIAAIELPTAAPYFAVIAGIVASSAGLVQEIALLALYNVAFVLPLLAIVAIIVFGVERADRWLQKGGAWLQRRWPVVLASLLLFVGSVLAVLAMARVSPTATTGSRLPSARGHHADAGTSGDEALRALHLSRLLRFLHVLSEDDETVEDVHAQGESAEAPPRVIAAD